MTIPYKRGQLVLSNSQQSYGIVHAFQIMSFPFREVAMLNEDILKGKWVEFRGGVRNLWGQITDDEIDETKGSFSKLTGLIQQKYGESKESINQKLDRLQDSFDNETDMADHDTAESSYQRNPTAEPTEDEKNFSIGRDHAVFNSSNFNSSSPSVGGGNFFEHGEYPENPENYQERSRGNIDWNARH